MQALKFAAAGVILAGTLYLCVWATDFIAIDHWGYAIAVNFLFMIVFWSWFGALFTPDFSSGYFAIRPFEQNGVVYRWLGVKYYVSVLRLIGWERILRQEIPINTRLYSLRKYEYSTKGSEAAHLLATLCVATLTVWAALQFSLAHIHWLVLFNIVLNVYPVILQRYNRPRVARLIRRKTALAAGQPVESASGG